jgi:hypothetical protein
MVHGLGLRLTKTDGELRVNFAADREESAYYTDNVEDAIGTARIMAEVEAAGL